MTLNIEILFSYKLREHFFLFCWIYYIIII